MSHSSKQKSLAVANADPFQMMKQALVTQSPWESITDFATHPSFCRMCDGV